MFFFLSFLFSMNVPPDESQRSASAWEGLCHKASHVTSLSPRRVVRIYRQLQSATRHLAGCHIPSLMPDFGLAVTCFRDTTSQNVYSDLAVRASPRHGYHPMLEIVSLLGTRDFHSLRL